MLLITISVTKEQGRTAENKPNYSFEVPLVIVALLIAVASKLGKVKSENSVVTLHKEIISPLSRELNQVNYPPPALPKSDLLVFAESSQEEELSHLPTDNNLVRDLAQKLGRNIIYGVPGTGKDFFLSHFYREVKNIHGNKATIFMLDCKNEPKETGYFEGVIHPRRLYRKKVFISEPQEVLEWLSAILREFENFNANTGFKILVINELAALNSKLAILPKNKKTGITPIQWWIDKLTGYGNSGDSEGISLFLASQNGHEKGVKLSGGDKSILTPFVIARETEMATTKLILQANIIPQEDKISTEEMLRLCKRSPVGRCIYHGLMHEWIPIPELENYSGYNRDIREFSKPQPEVNNQEGIIVKKLEATQSKTIFQFILEDLNVSTEQMTEVHEAIIFTLNKLNKTNLLDQFKPLDPIEEIKQWVKGLDKNPDSCLLKDYWLKLTGNILNEQGVKMLLENIGFKKS